MEDIEYRFFHELTPLEMCVLDDDWRIVYANPLFKKTISNYQPEEQNFNYFIESENRGSVKELLDKAQESFEIQQERLRVFSSSDAEYHIIVRYFPELKRYYLVFSKKSGESSQALQITDTLTGLPNRELFLDRLGQLIFKCNRTASKLAVLFMDLNGFKPVNDNYGHKAGDIVLKIIAERLQVSMRGMDTVARFGGDEFVVALSDIKKGIHTSLVAKRIMNRVEQPIDIGDNLNVNVTTSIGIALYPDDDESIQNLIKKADDAMYRAKNSRNGYLFYDMDKIFSN